MKLNRSFYFRAGAVLLLILIAAVMMIIGRGHTIYFDNKDIEYNGQTYKAFQEVCMEVRGQDDQFLYPRERGLVNVMGQNAKIDFEIMARKGSMSTDEYKETFKLPYSMDGIVINLPAYFAGLPQEVWMSEFVSLATTSDSTSSNEVITDEFSMSGF